MNSISLSRWHLGKTLFAVTLAVALAGCDSDDNDASEDNTDDSQPTTETMPIFRVEASGLSETQHSNLASALGLSPESVSLTAGAAGYIDPQAAMAVPQKPLAEPQTFADEEREEITVERGIDLEAVAELQAPNADRVQSAFREALNQAELMPGNDFPGDFQVGTSQATLRIYATDGTEEVSAPLNTRVGISPTLAGRPYIGAGAVIAVAYTLQDGEPRPSRLTYAWRQLRAGERVEVIEPSQARQRCRERLQVQTADSAEMTLDEPELVYYAPPLETQNASLETVERETPVARILPHYTCGGSVSQPDGSEANLAEVLIPAVADSELRPTFDLQANADGGQISATVAIEGGQRPYTVEWQSTHAELDGTLEEDATEIVYNVNRSRAELPETVSVTVRDANGIMATASQTLQVPLTVATTDRTRFRPLVGGETDFGSEGAGGAGWEKGVNDKFERVMRNQGVTQRFVWDGSLAWEDDFHAPADNEFWVDNADVVYYSGHGWPGAFTFHDKNHSDGSLNWRSDARGDWGDYDLEWLALLSCNVLNIDGSGSASTHVVNRWSDEFDGLHALFGFHTLAQLWDNTPKWFARAMTQPVSLRGQTFQRNVRQAWFESIEKTQAFREGVAMGPIAASGALTVSDYFWGRGRVGPDIPSNRIDKIWLVREGSYYHYNI